MHKAKILLVDDAEEILKTLSASLEDEGYEVWTARDGVEAMERVRTSHPEIIFLDIWLPGMDGIETLRAIKEFDADIEVVIMTGHGNVNTAVQAIKLGAFDFLEKPLSLDNVLEVIRKIQEQILLLKDQAETRFRPQRKDELIGASEVVRKLRKDIARLAKEEGPVLIVGEAGTGKELVARILHGQNLGKRKPLVKFNCTTWPEEELEEAIFGHDAEPGGRRKESRKSLLEQASGRTLYLDAIDELPPAVQARLAEYVRDRRKTRLPPAVLPKGPACILASSTKDLEKAVREGGKLSEQLLEIFQGRIIKIPPLRERKSDIPELAQFFLKTQCMEYGRKPKEFDDEALQALMTHEWPGNVKELKNIVERLVISVPISRISYRDIPPTIRGAGPLEAENDRLQAYELWQSYQDAEEAWERDYLLYHMKKRNGDLRTTAKALNMDVRRLARKVEKLNIGLAEASSRRLLRQRTLKRSVVLSGQGLHSGIKTGMILTPLPPDSGILFGSINTGEVVPARIDYVDSTEYATCLRKGTTFAKTTEHFLAVLHSYRIHNLLVKINDELPIMDGSALDFCAMIEDAGIEEQDGYVEEITVDRKYVIGEEGPDTKFIRIEPADALEIHYILQYPEPIGRQEVEFTLTGEKAFKAQIAPARTFGFLRDVEKLENMGLASGGRLNNVILVDDEKVVNTTLRFPDEFARHKILDILGDFYLLGRPVSGRITAQRTGHSDNYALMKLMREQKRIA
ncbi:MAG: UDP-3-O-acyl-N-acetylglucosamine deacetylase [bacterium]